MTRVGDARFDAESLRADNHHGAAAPNSHIQQYHLKPNFASIFDGPPRVPAACPDRNIRALDMNSRHNSIGHWFAASWLNLI
jgi:hypothetical protein